MTNTHEIFVYNHLMDPAVKGRISKGMLSKNGKSKVVPVLNKALHHEDIRGSRGIAPRILNL
jgi:hypothetical protein